MKENTKSEQDIFEELSKLTSSTGYIYAMPFLCLLWSLIIYDTKEKSTNFCEEESLNRTEIGILIGLMVKSDINFTIPTPEKLQEYIEQSKSLLQKLQYYFNWNHMKILLEELQNNDEQNNIGHLKHNTNHSLKNYMLKNPYFMREMLIYSADSAYDFQYLEFFYNKYKNDSDWLSNKYHFDIDDLKKIANEVLDQVYGIIYKLQSINDVSSVLDLFSFNVDELSSKLSITKEKVISILNLFTTEQNSNKEFNHINDFNMVRIKPFIKKDEDTYILLQHYDFLESLYESPFYWLLQDKNYKNIAAKHRGSFAENFVYETLIKVFGQDNTYKNIEIYDSKTRIGEIDVLVVFENRAIIVQIKSKRLTAESRKGNVATIDDDFQKAVQNAYNQGYDCAYYIQNKKYQIKNSQETFNFNHVEFKEIYIFCVVSDHYPALTIQAYNFIQYKETDVIKAPFIMDIFLLDVLSEMLDNPLYFLSYINKRTKYFKELIAQSEFTILSYHLRHNLYVDDKFKLLLQEEFTKDLDLAMLSRRRNVSEFKTPDGILTKFKNTIIGNFIESIKHNKNKCSIELGLFLLTLSEDTIKQINKLIQELSISFKKDNKFHDFSMPFDDATGLTVHIGNDIYDKAYSMLLTHCSKRKYLSQADNWFGIYFNPIEEKIKFVVMSDEKWVYSKEKGERIVANLKNKNIKIGRNEQCPCGSGKKYKKCCINK